MFSNQEVQHHIKLRAGDMGRYVLLPGDPDRAAVLAQRLENSERIAQNREYHSYRGELDGERVGVVSTGIGGPSAAIAVEELAAIGVETFCRVGTSGLMQPDDMTSGDLVVLTGAIRDEGTASQYMPNEYPAIADPLLVDLISESLSSDGIRHHVGIGHSKDSLYGELESARMPLQQDLQSRWQAWTRGGALASEMEAAAIFVVASVLGCRACALVTALNSPEFDEDHLCSAAVKALRHVIRNA